MLFCMVSYYGLMINFENQREVEFQRYEREIEALIKNTARELREMAEMIPFLDGMDKALQQNDKEKINQIFDQHWALLQFHKGIELVRFYDQSNQVIAHWNVLKEDVGVANIMRSWVQRVNMQEHPIRPILCRKSCMQYIVAPLLISGNNAGVVVLGVSLADTLLAFKQMTDTDIGLFVKERDIVSPFNGIFLAEWDVRVTALTNKNENLEILNRAILEHRNLSMLKKGIQIRWQGKFQQIKVFPLFGTVYPGAANFVVITDVTRSVNNIYESIWNIALIGLAGLVFSEILLLILFSRLLSRLTDVAFLLPLLANRDFNKFRSSLLRTHQKQRYNDEVDVLYESAAALSFQLERLEDKVVYRTKMLVKQRDELSKERDFIAHLLDTAQVIVLTQNSSGRIISLNAFGEMLTRYTENELKGTAFINLLSTENEPYELSVCLEEILLGQREQFRHEAVTNCQDGSTRHVAWLHSHLDWHSEDDPAVLSVGLDITEYKRVEGHLAWLADHDPLTNLYNRRRFSEELEQVLGWADRYDHPGALLFFDLDRFKYINDTSGHQAGDELLRKVSELLCNSIRTGDITGRLGGDEFAVILPEIKASDAIEVAKKLLSHLNDANLVSNNRTHKVSASIGIALFPEHGNNVHDLLAAADLAMYHAKETGRGSWHLFSSDDYVREHMHSLMYWKEKIEASHLHDNFLLYLQPIKNIKKDEIDYYEVLLRMRDEDGTIHSPAKFISAAEQTGLIHRIDHMVLHKAIALIAGNNQIGFPVIFSINLSAHAFNDPRLLPTLKHELTTYNVDPTSLVFEITETAALENLPGARNLMREIKELGCGFVLDDFGVGFSSFYYLRELPVDAVKLDGSFIRNLIQSPDDQILVKALCSVARGFGKKITAEFVENEQIYTLIKKMDIDYAQGYFIGKPAPHTDFFPEENSNLSLSN